MAKYVFLVVVVVGGGSRAKFIVNEGGLSFSLKDAILCRR